ncbi:MAG: InlB B-repeat-containing protein [Kiritimatiellae bacterium]|nr:InlB B-repeat-containing protein [Kiritimatiellia bacterium]
MKKVKVLNGNQHVGSLNVRPGEGRVASEAMPGQEPFAYRLRMCGNALIIAIMLILECVNGKKAFAYTHVAADDEEQVLGECHVTNDTTLYAHWAVNGNYAGGDDSGTREMDVGASVGTAQTAEQIVDEWYGALASKSRLTRIVVAEEQVDMDDITFPYRFTRSNAVLQKTLGGYRLDLNNTTIATSGTSINADGDIAIYVQGMNLLKSGNGMESYGGIHSESGSVLVFGDGMLSIQAYASNCNEGISASGNISVVGAHVTIQDADRGLNSWSGDILLSLSTVGLYNCGTAVYTQLGSIDILGAAVSITGSAGLRTSGNIVIDASAVNMLVEEFGTYYYSPRDDEGVFSASHSYVAFVLAGDKDKDHCAISAPHVWFDNCMVKVYSDSGSCIAANDVTFGKGRYWLCSAELNGEGASLYDVYDNCKSGVLSDGDVVIDGGDVKCCAPGNVGITTRYGSVNVKAGSFEVLERIDVAEMLMYDVALATTYGIVSTKVDLSSCAVNFYLQVVSDAISNAVLSNPSGRTCAGVFVLSSDGCYHQKGGTVWCDKSNLGINARQAIVDGGSCRGVFTSGTGYWGDPVITNVSPWSISDGVTNKNLKCVEYAVVGAAKGDNIAQSWNGILPSYYGTQSLYADENGKLYFWVPENWTGAGPGDGALPNLSVVTASVSKVYFDLSESVVVRWRVENIGGATAPESRIALLIYDYDKSGTKSTLANCEWMNCPSLLTGKGRDFKKTFKGTSLGHGVHAFAICIDGDGAISESDEDDNVLALAVQVFNGLTVSLNANGGALTDGGTIKVMSGTAIGVLPVPVRKGYKCLGWYTEKKSGKKVTAATIITKDMTLYARWIAAWTITLNANGGSLNGASKKVLVQKDKVVGTLAKPTRIGYVFKGWYTKKSNGTKITTTTKVTKNVTCYAKWTAKKYTVKLLKIGKGTVSGGGKKAYKSAITLKAKAAKGYVFKGWYKGEKRKSTKAIWKTKVPLNGATYTAKFAKIL